MGEKRIGEFRRKMLFQFANDWRSVSPSIRSQTNIKTEQEIEQAFATLFKCPDYILHNSKNWFDLTIDYDDDDGMDRMPKTKIDALTAYKPLYCEEEEEDAEDTNEQLVTIHSFKNAASHNQNEREEVAAQFDELFSTLNGNKN